jgi:hypothetical protein
MWIVRHSTGDSPRASRSAVRELRTVGEKACAVHPFPTLSLPWIHMLCTGCLVTRKGLIPQEKPTLRGYGKRARKSTAASRIPGSERA